MDDPASSPVPPKSWEASKAPLGSSANRKASVPPAVTTLPFPASGKLAPKVPPVTQAFPFASTAMAGTVLNGGANPIEPDSILM